MCGAPWSRRIFLSLQRYISGTFAHGWVNWKNRRGSAPRPQLPSGNVRQARSHPINSDFANMAKQEEQRRVAWWFVLDKFQPLSRVLTMSCTYMRASGSTTTFMPICSPYWARAHFREIHPFTCCQLTQPSTRAHERALWAAMELPTAARSGKILAMLLGPPCETWSSARFEQQLDENGRPIRGPRPLRGTTGMLGSTWPDAGGTSQLSVGNCLLLREFWLCIPVALCGGSVILKHPALPLQKERPWQTSMFCLGAAHCTNGSMVL